MFSLRIDDDLSVRLLEERHAPGLFDLIDRNRDHLSRWFPWVEGTTDVAHTRDFLRRSLQKFAAGDGFEAGLFRADAHVGMLGLHYLRSEPGRTELGYWLAADAQGQGIMTRAVKGLTRILFDDYGLERIEIRCHPDNVRSRAVPERLGFRQEGVLRRVGMLRGEAFDHVVYGLLAKETR